MGFIDSGSKSSRLLASRRYTHNTFTTAQESFTNVLDLRGEEIYTQAQYIPSSGLPFSSSVDHGSIHQASGSNLMKYWYRHKLTPSNTNTEVWFFLNPTGSDSGIGAQLIDDNQQTSFISPKYSTSALANATTEDDTPGYGVIVYKSSTYTQSDQTGSLGASDIVSGNDYIFDYKTGVLQFLSSAHDPASNEVVFMTAYQYVGQTLKTGLDIAGPVTASSFKGDGSGLTGLSSDSVSVAFADISGKPSLVSGSGQIADDISGSFNAGFETSGTISGSKDIFVGSFGNTYISGSNGNISASSADFSGNVTSTGNISGSITSTGSFGNIFIPDGGKIEVGNSSDLRIYHNGSHSIIRDRGTGNLILRTNAFQVKNSDDTETMLQANADGNVTLYHNNNSKFSTTSGGVSVTGNVTSTGTVSGSAIYGTTLGQNTGGGLKTITIEANSTVNQDLTTDANPTFADLTLTGDLTVQGDTTTLSTTNLKVGDQFIFTATGSAGTNVDGGLIVQSGSAVDSGSAIYHDTQDERWAVAKGVASDGTAVTPTAYVTTTLTANHNPDTTSGSYGVGEQWVNTTTDDIWIRVE